MAKEAKDSIFKIKLKPGDSKKALAFVVGYDRCFKDKGYRFLWSTGKEATRASFDPARPKKALKELVTTAELALESLEAPRAPGHQ